MSEQPGKRSPGADGPVRFRGRVLGRRDLERIRRTLRDLPGAPQVEVSRRLCEMLDFRRPNGSLAIRGCTALLFRLARQKRIRLPASWRRVPGRRQRARPSTDLDSESAFAPSGTVQGQGLELRLAESGERAAFRGLMERHHYLGYRQPGGESVYQIAFWNGMPVALMQWSSAALHNRPRDAWAGWDRETKGSRLHLVANNVRFLLLPQAQQLASNMASRVLSHSSRRISADFERLYAHPVLLAETFVDPSRFNGTCYLASNWIRAGETGGWARRGRIYAHHGQRKLAFLYPLHRRARKWLTAEKCPGEAFIPREVPMMLDVDKLALEGHGGLFEVLRTIKEPRKPRGMRHSLQSILAMAATAAPAGLKSVAAIAQWAEDLPEDTRKRLGSTRPEAPDESTFRRVLALVDAEEFDRKTSEWAMRHKEVAGAGIAIDGKTLRGSRDGESAPVHLASAVLHADGTVLSQTRVPQKSNEIMSVKPLLKDMDARGAVITGDAMLAQTGIAKHLVEEKRADYLFTVKDNQPGLGSAIEDMGLESFSPSVHPDRPRPRAH